MTAMKAPMRMAIGRTLPRGAEKEDRIIARDD
jgi:hypothetical protein